MRTGGDASGLGLGPGFSFVAAASATGSGVLSVNITVPAAVQNGDTIIIAVAAYNTTISATGFTLLDNMQGNQSTNHKGATLWRTAASEGSTWTVSFGTSTWPICTAYILRGGIASPVANHGSRSDAASYVTSLPAPTSPTINSVNDAVVYAYTGVDSLGSGTESATNPGSLNNWSSQGNSSLGGIVGIGWGTNVSAPGSATVSPDGQDYNDAYIDLTPAGPFPPQCLLNQAVNRASTW